MMKKIRNEFFLCVSNGILSAIFTVILGVFYKANDQVIIVNVLIWTAVVLLSYLAIIFWPVWKKKRTRYIDLLAFASGYAGVIICCLCGAKSIDQYNYLTTISFMVELLAIAEMVMSANRNLQSKINDNSLSQIVIKKLENEPIDVRTNLTRVILSYKGTRFSVSDITFFLNSTKYYANKIVLKGVEIGMIVPCAKKKGQYKVVQNENTVLEHP